MRYLIGCLLFLSPLLAQAYNYNEHKAIGNAALSSAITRLLQNRKFSDSSSVAHFMGDQLHLRYNPANEEWIFSELSQAPNAISYGDLNGLAGDHQSDPLAMNDQLRYRYSTLNRIVLLQTQYGEQFFTNAPDKRLLNTDFQYGLLALTNFDHFYAYGKSLSWHLQTVRRQDIIDLLIPANTERVFKRLQRQNAVRMYVTLHAVAIQLAQMAGQSVYRGDGQTANQYLFYAILYNAFADHFAQDMCAAGHLVVKRSLAGGITNNRALHDFYNQVGLPVLNLKGEVWKTNGDGTLNAPEGEWRTAQAFALLTRTPLTVKYRRAVAAAAQSIYEVLDAYLLARQGGKEDLTRLLPDGPPPGQADQREAFYLKRFGTLSLVPLPLDSDVPRYFVGSARVDSLTELNRIPFYRSYIRSRVANNLVLGLGSSREIGSSTLTYILEGRIILSSRHYHYQNRTRKIGTFDTWRGLTASYVWGNRPVLVNGQLESVSPSGFHQIKGGLNFVGDLWVTNNTYVGFHSYVETGVDLRYGQPALLISPSFGVQFLPFAAGRAGRLPKWTIRLLQVIVSQKLVASYQLIAGRPSQMFIQTEFDVNL
jgi:hypothetical protein